MSECGSRDVQKLYVIGPTKSLGDSLTSLVDKPEVTSSLSLSAREDDVVLVTSSSDVHDIAAIVQLTNGNITALWTQLRYCLIAFEEQLSVSSKWFI